MLKKANTIAITIILILCSFQTVVVHATVKTYSANSSYKTWNGKKVGATTLGVWYDDAAQGTEMPRIELGVSGSRGNTWYDYPQPGTYTVTTDNYQLTLTATSIWIDLDGDGVKDPGEPSGSVDDVYFVNVHTGKCGSSAAWDYLVNLMWNKVRSLTGVIFPNPFDLLDYQSESDGHTVLQVNPSVVNNYASVRTRLDYYGWEIGVHYITIQCKTKATFYVWHEPGTKGAIIDSTLAYTTSITQTKNITIKITVT